MKHLLLLAILPLSLASYAQSTIPTVGRPLPSWQEGCLDLYHINTGRGNAAFYILPDGTTILFDAGELDPTNARTKSKRNTPIKPNDSKRPFEWIADFIKRVGPAKNNSTIDYAVISHFHDDHFGGWYQGAPLSKSKKFTRSGITGVADIIPTQTLLTRDYHYPVDPAIQLKAISSDNPFARSWHNYESFLDERKAHGHTDTFLKAGSKTQIHLVHHPNTYPGCYVQNIKSNGWIWTGADSTTQQHFPPIDTTDKRTWPDENTLSNVLTIHYGPFTYYTGGDCPGNVFLGDAPWRDVETPVAKAVGPVDVATMDHHGNRDAVNEFQVKTLQPSVWIEQVWTADHPGHETLIRATSQLLYKGKRDLFATNFMEANHLVIGPLVDRSYRSLQGHILVRVLPGGQTYYVIIIDDSYDTGNVKAVYGPYISKRTQ